jgi:predicted Zn-dependent peptidase
MKVGLLTALESPARRAEQLARHVLAYGRVLARNGIVATIDAITVADVARAGQTMLAGAPTLVAVGPVRKLQGIDAITRRLGAHPSRVTSG